MHILTMENVKICINIKCSWFGGFEVRKLPILTMLIYKFNDTAIKISKETSWKMADYPTI